MDMDTTDMTMVTLAPITTSTATMVFQEIMAITELSMVNLIRTITLTKTGMIGDTTKPLIMKGTSMDSAIVTASMTTVTTLLITLKTTVTILTISKIITMVMDKTLDTPTITDTTEQTTVLMVNTTMDMATQRVTTLPTTENTSISELIEIVNRRRKGCLFSCDDL